MLSPQIDEVKLKTCLSAKWSQHRLFFLLRKTGKKNFFIKFVLWLLFFSQKFFFFSASRPGLENPRPKKKFLRRNSLIFRYFGILLRFFSNAAHRPNPGWPPQLQTDFQRFGFFLCFSQFKVLTVEQKKKKMENFNSQKCNRFKKSLFIHITKSNQILEESFSGLLAAQFPTVGLNIPRSKRSTVVFRRSLWNLDCDGNQR